MKPPRLVRRKFREWLADKKPRQVVGERKIDCGCPLARFLCEEKGIDVPSVTETTYGIFSDRGFVQRNLPSWASSFVAGVDASGYPGTFITAATALRILDGVK